MNREIIKQVDQVAVQMEEKYGYIDRLLELVPEDLAAKFTRAKEKFDKAISSNNALDMDRFGQALIRGYKALDNIAKDTKTEFWQIGHPSGKQLMIYKGPRPQNTQGFIVMSIEELVKFVPGTILDIKSTFPKSKVIK
tara:strand:- start:779 stop:1192 length:414 start_codon:yes stop_codon:yes gene_type:complete